MTAAVAVEVQPTPYAVMHAAAAQVIEAAADAVRASGRFTAALEADDTTDVTGVGLAQGSDDVGTDGI